jgi:hypothetical protein
MEGSHIEGSRFVHSSTKKNCGYKMYPMAY